MTNTTTTVLTIASREISHSEGGPLHAEYALFDGECIELRKTEPGIVREVGYRTTVAEARHRLDAAGLTIDVALRASAAMKQGLASFFARGPVVRRVVQSLGPRELFQGRIYQAEAKTYDGVWLDLRVLGEQLGDGGAVAMQLFHLISLLHEAPDDADVFLGTLGVTRPKPAGFRSHRRVSLSGETWAERIALLASRFAGGTLHESGPSRVEILDELGASFALANDAGRARLAMIERATAVSRTPPARGPLSDPAAWSIESQINAGDVTGAMNRISAMEQTHPVETPSLVYLRSRTALLAAREEPRVIAERVSKLAARASFAELELLAAQAWAAAGDMARALPFARTLASNDQLHEELRAHAMRIVRAAERGEVSLPPGFLPSAAQQASEPPATVRPPPEVEPTRTSHRSPSGSSQRASNPWQREVSAATGARGSLKLDAALASPATPRMGPEPKMSPLPFILDPLLASAPEMQIDIPIIEESGVHTLARQIETPLAHDPRRVPTEPPPPSNPVTWMRGASQPAFRAIPRRTTPAHFAAGVAGVAETLSDPVIEPLADYDLAQRLLEIRVQFTQMARELGRLYRVQHNIELRTDLDSIEAIQTQLRDRYAEKGIRSQAAAADVRRHGALLSEILVRTLGGRWIDVEPQELGHWAMVLPSQVRVWPFGRVLRLIAMGNRERDLVSYYLELCARSK